MVRPKILTPGQDSDQEGATPTIIIEGDEPLMVKAMLRFFFCGEYHTLELKGEDFTPKTAHVVADTYDVLDLREYAAQRFRQEAEKLVDLDTFLEVVYDDCQCASAAAGQHLWGAALKLVLARDIPEFSVGLLEDILGKGKYGPHEDKKPAKLLTSSVRSVRSAGKGAGG
ncbi:hypothetical protein K432DRAFT_453929 [Lepidopterella palustris CBS 459.81]|uniref:BTB domain-containing protein n=1 Tax=Lepidopterella palustris CBS 459.81 TaxID=1314670 RepID=A0A8E2JEX8_9PEZI|nr:hypothetical protein K432DRAFT_453929 [Lepidopterella palustris CBS 459.81]